MNTGKSLIAARAWYAVIGVAALLVTASEILGDFTPGAVVDVPNLAAGLAVGLLAICAAAWVEARGRLRAAVTWLGIAAGFAPFAWLFWIAVSTTSIDAILLAAVPTAVAGLAAVRMVLGRARSRKAPLTAESTRGAPSW